MAYLLSNKARDLAPEVLDENGHPKIMPAEFYAETTQEERSLLCVRHGIYCLPTVELVEWLKTQIGTDSAIEIGAGNGILAKALGIRATDSHQQALTSRSGMLLARRRSTHLRSSSVVG